MRRRAIVLFWGAAAASVFFLGAAWSSAAHLGPGPNAFANRLVLFVALIGFAGTTLVAGRIAFVVGRAQRHARRGGAGKGRFRRETGKRSEMGTAGDLVDEAVEVGPHVPPGANGVPSVEPNGRSRTEEVGATSCRRQAGHLSELEGLSAG